APAFCWSESCCAGFGVLLRSASRRCSSFCSARRRAKSSFGDCWAATVDAAKAAMSSAPTAAEPQVRTAERRPRWAGVGRQAGVMGSSGLALSVRRRLLQRVECCRQAFQREFDVDLLAIHHLHMADAVRCFLKGGDHLGIEFLLRPATGLVAVA